MNQSVSIPAGAQLRQLHCVRIRRRFAAFVLLLATCIATAAEPTIRILKGSHQQTTYASQFPAPLTVWVVDSVSQQSLAGVEIRFSADEGIALSAMKATTDEHGLASVTAAALTPGSFSVCAQVDRLPGTQVRFSALVVNKAVLTVVPADLAVHSGETIPAITDYTIQGFVNGDTEANAQITGSPILTTTAKDNSPHANYAIKGGVGTLASPNYTFVAGFGTLAVAGLDSSAAPPGIAEAALDPGTDPPPVRPALSTSGAAGLREPAFLAGLRGQSGIFVQKAISATAASQGATLSAQVRNAALPKAWATASSAAPAPVRAAVAARPVAMPMRSSDSPAKTAPALKTPATPASATSPYAGSSTRQALIVPGVK